MKKFLALLLTCLLCLPVLSCLSASPALALEPEMSKTRSFCALLDEEGIYYEFTGKSSSGNEHVCIPFGDDNFTYDINLFFHPDNDMVNLHVWYIITFDDADFVPLLRLVNDLNTRYNYTRFYLDETDNTVTCSVTMLLEDEDDAADIIMETVGRLYVILERAYPELAVYNK